MTAQVKKLNLYSAATAHAAKRSGQVRSTSKAVAGMFGLGLMAACLVHPQVHAAEAAAQLISPVRPLSGHQEAVVSTIVAAQTMAPQRTGRAYFARENASEVARRTADWIVDSGDNHHLPFLIVDKENAKVFVFDSTGKIKGATAALLGMARGDDSVPDIGQRKLSTIKPDERTTPAGRFVATLGRNLHGKEILWVDYGAAISLHRVVTSNRKERRAERLMSPTTVDNRISYGCINVPVTFYEHVVSPAFRKTSGIVYVLPETRSTHETFGSYDVDDQARRPAPALALVPAEGKLPDSRIIKLR
ncbi:MAG: hypothetical protein A3I66_21575 [Burkholderiales bacterium RIFCSPLOWO2_02_FULL_57_36]|nr:MAG: hypothetical protein A3I66_21575 [Burkholderiales bacterium RIFCSPLOWO2_02_FULL_57_36]